jgi:hypothetical protein
MMSVCPPLELGASRTLFLVFYKTSREN